MVIGTFDFYHLIPLLLTSTLPGGHKVSAKQKLMALFSCTLADQDEIRCGDEIIQAEHPETIFE